MDKRSFIAVFVATIIGLAVGEFVMAPLFRDPCPDNVVLPDNAYRVVVVAERALHAAARRDSINALRVDSLMHIVDSLTAHTAPLPVLIDHHIHATRDLGVDSLHRGLLRRPE